MEVFSNPIFALLIGPFIAIAMLLALLWAVLSVDKRLNRGRGDFFDVQAR